MRRKKNCPPGDRECYLYIVTHRESGNDYVGVTTQKPKKRWTQHKSDAKAGSQRHFARAIRLYGADAFEWKVIARYRSEEIALRIEVLCRTRLGYGHYNMTDGGEGAKNLCQDARDAISAAVTARMANQQTRQQVSQWMQTFWATMPEEMREGYTNRIKHLWDSEQFRECVAKGKANYWASGAYTEECRERDRLKTEALWQDPEYRAKQDKHFQAKIGTADSEEVKLNKSAGAFVSWADPEFKAARMQKCSKTREQRCKDIAAGLLPQPEPRPWSEDRREKYEQTMEENGDQLREAASAKSIAMWEDPAKRAEMVASRHVKREAKGLVGKWSPARIAAQESTKEDQAKRRSARKIALAAGLPDPHPPRRRKVNYKPPSIPPKNPL